VWSSLTGSEKYLKEKLAGSRSNLARMANEVNFGSGIHCRIITEQDEQYCAVDSTDAARTASDSYRDSAQLDSTRFASLRVIVIGG
jgi:hypothetical protein